MNDLVADMRWMRLALEEASKGRGAVEPNPMVGAAVVRDDRLVGLGRHEVFGGPHAEVFALAAAGDEARGATLYVTLEPCCHHGKTPPCVDAVLRAGVARVVAAHRDPFPRVAGGGFARLREAGVEVVAGVLAAEAIAMNAPYLKRVVTGRPYVIAKWAMTLDGKTAVAGGDSRWISSPESRALVHAVRGRMDAILVGIGTALADDPLLTARPQGPRNPLRIVLDPTGRLPTEAKLVQTAGEHGTLVVVGRDAKPEAVGRLRDAGCDVWISPEPGRPSIPSLLDELGRRGTTNLLVEGGGLVLGAFFDSGEVDEVDVYVAPLIEGGDHPRSAVRGEGRRLMQQAARLRDVRRTLVAEDVRIQGDIWAPWRDRLSGLADAGLAEPT